MKKKLLFFATLFVFGMQSFAQDVGINNGGGKPDPTAALDVKVP